MALTQVSTSGIKDATVATADIADNAVTAGKLASGVQTSINNNANNRVITGSGTANTLEGEANLTFDGQALTIGAGYLSVRQGALPQVDIQHSTDTSYSRLYLSQNSGSGGYFAINKIGTNGSGYTGGSNSVQLWSSADAPMLFATNNAEKMRIDSSGRLLLGTTTEGHDNADNLTVADTGNSGITIRSGTGNAGNIYFSDGTSGGAEYDGYIAYSQSINSLDFGTNNATRLRIDSSGNVGIGNTNPSSFHSSGENLVIGSGSGDEGMTVYSGTGNSGIINFADGTSGSDSYEGRILYRHADNAMSFHTNNGAERVRINSGGAVLIGTTTGTTDSSCNLRVNFDQNTSSGRAIEISHNTNGADKAGAALGLSIDNGGESTNAATLTFSTASGGSLSERMRIASAGHTFFQGMTSLTASTSNKGINIENQSNNGRMNIHANNSAGNVLGIGFYHSGSHVGGIYYSSSATSYNTSSDYRLKENVTAISDGITRLKTLKPSRFNFKVDKDTKVDGFLAHEVTAVPEAITGTKDEVDSDKKPVYQSIDQSKLVPLLTAALQEAITKVETLEKKVAALEAK